MKAAIIGLGVIGRVHLDVLLKQNQSVVAICDIDNKKKNFLSENNLSCTFYEDYLSMLDSEQIDIVHICTPHYLHAQMIIECLKRNINVLCEKPLCISLSEIDEILLAESKSSAILGVCQQNRYNKVNLFVKNYLQGKKVIACNGTLFWHRDENYFNQGLWRSQKSLSGGGVMINQALHTLDLIQWWIGFPSKVISNYKNLTLNRNYDIEDMAYSVFKGKHDFTFFASIASGYDFPIEVMIRLENEIMIISKDSIIINNQLIDFKEQKFYVKECYGEGHYSLINDFYQCVRNKTHFSIDGKEAAKVVRLILAIYQSQGHLIEIK